MRAQPIDDIDPDHIPDFDRPIRICLVGSGVGFVGLASVALAHLFTAAESSHLIVGLIVLAGAGIHLGNALVMRGIDASRLWSLSGIFYLLAGIAIVIGPSIGARALTLALAVMLAISGVGRLVIGIREQAQWLLLSGCASILTGTVIGIDWPQNSFWMIGALAIVDLLAQGIALILTGFVHRFAVIDEEDD